jgi:hypothetical protein
VKIQSKPRVYQETSISTSSVTVSTFTKVRNNRISFSLTGQPQHHIVVITKKHLEATMKKTSYVVAAPHHETSELTKTKTPYNGRMRT